MADLASGHLHGIVAADLLNLAHIGTIAGDGSDEAGVQRMPTEVRGIEASGPGASLHDAGDGMVG
ncbi:MAG: hypothetical protein ACRYF2_04640 [Janthinobacterium lividum]